MAEFQLRRMSSARTGVDDPGGKCECPDCDRLRADAKAHRRMLARYLAETAGHEPHRQAGAAP